MKREAREKKGMLSSFEKPAKTGRLTSFLKEGGVIGIEDRGKKRNPVI